MTNPPKTTIYTISKEFGVSPSTVSKALNNSPEISPTLCAQIRKLAKSRNYRPRLFSTRTPNICALIQQIEGHPLDFGPFLARILEGMARYTREENLELSIYTATVNELNHIELVRELRKRGMDGAVVLRANKNSAFYKQLEKQNFPYVSLLSNNGVNTTHYIGLDDMQSAKLAVRYLLDLGHRAIGLMDHSPNYSGSHDRTKGYAAALREAGIQANPQWVITPGAQQVGLSFGREGCTELLKRCPEVTALLTLDHSTAVGALSGLRKIRKQVPKDISLISFDDYPESEYLCPALTTVGAPIDVLGYQAARYVYRRMRDQDPMDSVINPTLQYQLRVRESTARPKTRT